MTKPTIYLAGPMTGYADYNFPAFNYVADFLRAHGYPVVNPADFGDGESNWKNCLKRALVAMMNCDMVVALPGSLESKGASLEIHVAWELGIKVEWFFSFIRGIDITDNMCTRVLKRATGVKLPIEAKDEATPQDLVTPEPGYVDSLPVGDFAEAFADAVVFPSDAPGFDPLTDPRTGEKY